MRSTVDAAPAVDDGARLDRVRRLVAEQNRLAAQLTAAVRKAEVHQSAEYGLLCERHHTKVHHGFRIERRPAGRWRTWRPDGTEILVATPEQRRSPAVDQPATGPRSSAVRIRSGHG